MPWYLFLFYILLGILPSLVWLFYYLKKDLHPEPKKTILKMFFLGALVTIPVFFIQIGLSLLLDQFSSTSFFAAHTMLIDGLRWFFIIALTEELSKYLVVKFIVLNTDAVDEPLDMMLYMVVAALGFAAVENIMYLFSSIHNAPSFDMAITTALIVLFIRFVGATFLHTLCSGLVGYFLAKASVINKKKVLLTGVGLVLAVLLHGFYNFSIITLPMPLNTVIPALIILGLALFMLYDFDQIEKIKGICKL